MKHMVKALQPMTKVTMRQSIWSCVSIGLFAVVLTLFGCSKSQPAKPAPPQTLSVFAAASLRGPFTVLGEEFHKSNPNVVVSFNFAGTQELRTQLEHGAKADVFASADQKHMNELVKAGQVQSPTVFINNEPVIVVSKESAQLVKSIADLPSLERIVLGVPDVPIGRYSIQILDRASTVYGADFRKQVEAKVRSRELNVKQVLAKVTLGEAQAGIVYRSDVLSQQDKVSIVAIDSKVNVIAEYPIALVAASTIKDAGQRFVTFVLSKDGQRELSKAGFTSPLLVASTP
jgi:molybdate transport system substrate-binding protein